MAAVTLNVSLSEEQVACINREVDSGQYTSASEVVREALRQWLQRRIEVEVAELEKAHHGAWERDVTEAEQAVIVAAKREVRAERLARRKMARQ